jgi:DNA-binding MarR family transcriptional regulator
MGEDTELARDLRLAIGRVARRLRRAYVDAGEGLSFLELAMLQRLERDGQTSPGTLADDEGVTSAAVAATLSALERKGMVTRRRSTQDGRRIVVTISSTGQRTLHQRESASVSSVEAALQQLTAADRRRLAAVIPTLEKVAEAL